ncbi:MAG: hypothetical protein L0312_26795, partial [Acidobacteria bacterium]|nr:hypothetical protein [Acidobacteriota bacterium]
AAIKDLERIGAKTKLRLNRVARELAAMEQRLEELKREEQLWSERAVKIQPVDEARALECVRRLRATRKQIQEIETQRQKTLDLRLKISGDLDRLSARLNELKRKKELLASRENQAEAMKLFESSALESDSIEAIFERWEERVTASEFTTGSEAAESDPLAAEFAKEEELMELRALLNQLIEDTKQDSTDEQEKLP